MKELHKTRSKETAIPNLVMKTKLFVLLTSIASCFFLSCTKESTLPEIISVTDQAQVKKLKTFYEGLTSAKNLQANWQPDQGLPDWTKIVQTGDKYLIPLSQDIQRSNNNYAQQKYLLLSEEGNTYKGEYVYEIQDSGDDLLTLPQMITRLNSGALGSISTNNKSALAKADIVGNETNAKQGNHIKYRVVAANTDTTISGRNLPPANCEANGGTLVEIEWWYQEYDNYGNVIYEEYVYTTHECWGIGSGGSGGGGSTPLTDLQICEMNVEAALATVKSVSNLISTANEASTDLTRTRLYNWQYAKAGIGGTLKGIAYDRGIHARVNTRPNTPWKWQSLAHVSSTTQGVFTGPKGTSLKLQVVHAEPVIGEYHAKMFLIWQAETKAEIHFSTVTRTDVQNSTMTYHIDTPPLIDY